MARILIAGASEASRGKLAGLLAGAGFETWRLCGSGGELRRAMTACEDGVAVIAVPLPGCLPDELLSDFGMTFLILLVGRPETLALCESPDLFRLALPASSGAVTGAVEMLTQLHAMRLPRRTGDEKALVERAKALLMARDSITEPQAHRRLQRYAMEHNVRMAEVAERIINNVESGMRD